MQLLTRKQRKTEFEKAATVLTLKGFNVYSKVNNKEEKEYYITLSKEVNNVRTTRSNEALDDNLNFISYNPWWRYGNNGDYIYSIDSDFCECSGQASLLSEDSNGIILVNDSCFCADLGLVYFGIVTRYKGDWFSITNSCGSPYLMGSGTIYTTVNLDEFITVIPTNWIERAY